MRDIAVVPKEYVDLVPTLWVGVEGAIDLQVILSQA